MASGQSCLALPRRSAGDPATSCPALTLPSTAEPGSTWPPAPMLAPGMRVLRAPTVAPAPMWTWPMCTMSPSIHQPERSTSGSTLLPLPSDRKPGDRRQRVQMDVAADLGAEGPGVVGNPRCAGQADGAGQVLDLLGQPEPQVHPAGPRVGSGHHVPEQQAGRRDRDGHPARRADEDQPGRCRPTTRTAWGRPLKPAKAASRLLRCHQVGQPAHAHENVQRDAHQGLEDLRLAGGGPHRPVRRRTCRNAVGQGLAGGVDQGADPRRGIDVRHRDGGVAHAEGRDELGGRQRAAAVGEEVGVEAVPRCCPGRPPTGPRSTAASSGRFSGAAAASAAPAPGSGQGSACRSTLPLVLVGRLPTTVSIGMSGAGRRGEQQFPGGRQVQLAGAGGGEVAHQDLVAGRRRADRGSCARHARKGLQGGVDFAEFDPAAAQLDLFIGAAHEDQARRLRSGPGRRSGRRGPSPREGMGAYFSASFCGSR